MRTIGSVVAAGTATTTGFFTVFTFYIGATLVAGLTLIDRAGAAAAAILMVEAARVADRMLLAERIFEFLSAAARKSRALTSRLISASS